MRQNAYPLAVKNPKIHENQPPQQNDKPKKPDRLKTLLIGNCCSFKQCLCNQLQNQPHVVCCLQGVQLQHEQRKGEDSKLKGMYQLSCFLSQVSLVLSFPAIHCQDFSGVSLGTGDLHLFHLVTMAHIIQILLTSSTGNATLSQLLLKRFLQSLLRKKLMCCW